MQNAAANNIVHITTFAGPADICRLPAALFNATILDVTRQSAVPYDLGNPSYQQTSAIVNNTKPDVDIREHVLGLA